MQHYTFHVSSRCQLRCGFCTLWQKDLPLTPQPHWVNLIETQQFFTVFPFAKHYHIVGGDPSVHPNLPLLLSFLKSKGIRVHLWTHGVVPHPFWEQVVPHVDSIRLYLPASDPGEYRRITGETSFETLADSLILLKSKPVDLILHTPITLDTVSWLPYTYDFVFKHKIPWWIHYHPQDGYDDTSEAYLLRFRNIHNVWVFKTQFQPHFLCAAFPFDAVQDPWQRAQYAVWDFLKGIRKALGL
ncbi:MAG: radical SAM protein [Candidatus Margulisiibacteriota bacterium]